jgi:hypothetical protein
MTAPMRAGIQRKFHVSAARNIATGFDLAGGCGTRSNSISAVARTSANAIEYHMSPTRWKQAKPIVDAMKCPPIIFLGCEKGTSSAAITKKIVALKDPKSSSRLNLQTYLWYQTPKAINGCGVCARRPRHLSVC